jgi:hypothetical protein
MNFRFKSIFFDFIKYIKEMIVLGFIAFSDVIHIKWKHSELYYVKSQISEDFDKHQFWLVAYKYI